MHRLLLLPALCSCPCSHTVNSPSLPSLITEMPPRIVPFPVPCHVHSSHFPLMTQSSGLWLLLVAQPRMIQSGALHGLVLTTALLHHHGLVLITASLHHHGLVLIAASLHHHGVIGLTYSRLLVKQCNLQIVVLAWHLPTLRRRLGAQPVAIDHSHSYYQDLNAYALCIALPHPPSMSTAKYVRMSP